MAEHKLVDRVSALQAIVGYPWSRLTSDPNYRHWRAGSPLAWRTVTARASELIVSLSAAKNSSKLARNKTYPALVSAQLELLRETLIVVVPEQQRQHAMAALETLPSTYLSDIASAPGGAKSKETSRNLLAVLIDEKGVDPLASAFALVEMGRAHWQGVDVDPEDGGGQIFREIKFAPEHQQAGIAILSYFAVVLRQKLPDVDATVSITQDQDRVILTISHGDGTEEKIVQALAKYGLVVKGQMQPEELLENPLQAMALKHKLELSNMELRQTRELLHLERSRSSQRFEALESEVTYLRDHLSAQLDSGLQLGQGLLEALKETISALPKDIEPAVAQLLQAVMKRDEAAVRSQAEELSATSPDLFSKVSAFITSNALAGPIGNAAYDWLKIVWPVLPK